MKIPDKLRAILYMGLLSGAGTLCTFSWNDTFLDFWLEWDKGRKEGEAKRYMRKCIRQLMVEGIISKEDSKISGTGAGGDYDFGVKAYKVYYMYPEKTQEIRKWLKDNDYYK